MLAYLGGGEHDGARILEPDTVAEMHRTQFTPHPELAGVGYGFFEHLAGERRGVQHGGSWVGASAHLYLLPEADLGMFVAFNHGPGSRSRTRSSTTPSTSCSRSVEPTTGVSGVDADRYAGQYRWNRHDTFTFMRIVSTLGGIRLEVTANDDGTLDTAMAPVGLLPDTRWVASGPGVFVEEGGTSTLVFDTGDGRRGDRAACGRPAAVLHGSPRLVRDHRVRPRPPAGVPRGRADRCGRLARRCGHRRLRRTAGDVPADLRRARRLAGLAGGLLVAFVVGLFGHFILDMGGLVRVSPVVQGLLWLPWSASCSRPAWRSVVVRLWRAGEGSTAGRVYLSSIAVGLLAFVPFLYHLRLLGFHY
jgi:hypothetical protein